MLKNIQSILSNLVGQEPGYRSIVHQVLNFESLLQSVWSHNKKFFLKKKPLSEVTYRWRLLVEAAC